MRLARRLTILGLVALAGAPGFAESARLEANKELVRRFTAVLNSADWDGLDELLTENFTRHCQATPEIRVTTREQFKQLQDSFLRSVPDQHIELGMLVAEGDKVAASAVYSGTQTGEMGGIPPTGKRFESHFLSIFRIEDGRLAELWVEWDNVAILSQLGVFPPPAPEAAEAEPAE